jgi:hypothetical protein
VRVEVRRRRPEEGRMDVFPGLAFKCELCGSNRFRQETKELRGGPSPLPLAIAVVLYCLDCGQAVPRDDWMRKNAPKK